MEAVHHFELSPQIFLGQVVQHAGIHQTLHEVTAVLWEPDGGQPLVTDPLVIHVSKRKSLQHNRARCKFYINLRPLYTELILVICQKHVCSM